MGLTGILLNQGVRKASSLILLKPKLKEYEVLMLKRPNEGTFKGMTVFPGGAVDKADSEENFKKLNNRSLIKEAFNNLTEFKLSSIRETFEETGILLTNKQPNITSSELFNWRIDIVKNPDNFFKFLNTYELTPSMDEIYPVSRWITPTYMKRRFDTVFFTHILTNNNQLASINTKSDYLEATQLNWETPQNWLNRQLTDNVDFMPPQFYFCQLLNKHLSSVELLKENLKNNKITELEGYLPNHVNIETKGVNLAQYNIKLPSEYNLFYTILPGDKDYNQINTKFVEFNESELNEKFEEGRNYHRVLGIRNKQGHMKMLKLLTNLGLKKEGSFEFY